MKKRMTDYVELVRAFKGFKGVVVDPKERRFFEVGTITLMFDSEQTFKGIRVTNLRHRQFDDRLQDVLLTFIIPWVADIALFLRPKQMHSMIANIRFLWNNRKFFTQAHLVPLVFED
jgi:hypothetical protein